MEYTVVKQDITGIKCDKCDWNDMSFKWTDINETIKQWLGKPCPKCGAVLLTQEDANLVLNMQKSTDKMNSWCNKWLPNFILKWLSKNLKHYSADMDGSGKLKNIKEKN